MYQKGHSNCRGGREIVSFMGPGGMDSKLMVLVCMWDPGQVCSGVERVLMGTMGLLLIRKLVSQESFCVTGLWHKGMHTQSQWSVFLLLLEQHFFGNICLWKTLYPPFTITDPSPFPFPSDDDFLKTILAKIHFYAWGKKNCWCFTLNACSLLLLLSLLLLSPLFDC